MKKYFSFILIFILTTLLLKGQMPGEIKWKENIAKNRIRSQVQWNHKYKKGTPVKEGYKNFLKKFDHKGNLIEEVYFQSGSIDQKLSYKYDNNDNKVEFVNYNNAKNKVMFQQNITYDNNGLKIREERYNGEDYEIIKYTYNSQGKLMKIVRSDVSGSIKNKRVFNYKGNICNVNIYSDKTTLTGKIVNKYDSNDNIIETIEYDTKGKAKEKFVYTFKNNLVQDKAAYVGTKFIYKEIYKYDTKKNLIKILKEQPKGKIIVNNIYKYNQKGNLIEEQWYDNNPSENSKKTYYYNDKDVLERVEVYYALYKYRIQYKYEYTKY
ncbi:MAG: hypothetical protein MI739_09990 [Bacteroidales bacterium]|nr:hypothetical protein [Bacteroidales bacterium]